MISLDKKYKTRSGKEVVIIEYKKFNSAGSEVSFPFKGSVIHGVVDGVKKRNEYAIWTEDGDYDIFFEHDLDLIEVKECSDDAYDPNDNDESDYDAKCDAKDELIDKSK